MHFSQRAIEMAWAQCAQPLFHKEEAIARKALEEGDGTKVSQLFIFMHIDVGGVGRGGREFVRGEEADLQDKAETHLSWSATADGTFKVVVGRCLPSHRHLGQPHLTPLSSSSCEWQSAGTSKACSTISLYAAIRPEPPSGGGVTLIPKKRTSG